MQQIPFQAYKFNSQTNEIKFFNGSEIIFKDLFSYPSDPNFDELGSLEITGCFIDEAVQVKEKAKNILKSRIRFKLDEYNLVPKMLYTSNPGKGWLYRDFYIPFRESKLPDNRKFVQSLLTDNPYISEFYHENLQTLDKESKERLLKGNWEYEQEGLIFPEEQLKRFDFSKLDLSTMQIISFTDVADQGDDYLSMAIGAMHGKDVYLIDVVYSNHGRDFCIPEIVKMFDKYNISMAIFESNNMGLVYSELVRSKLPKEHQNKIKPLKETSNKHSRIVMQADTRIMDFFYFRDNPFGMYAEFIEHLTSYRHDKSFKIDDAPDSLAGLSMITNRIR